MKWLDIPPVWLLGTLVLAWLQKTYLPMGLDFGPVVGDFLGGLCVGGGVVLIALAATEMRRHRTTVIPHMEADKLVTSGVFKRSRNPIYLGDALILAGLVFFWDAVLSLVLVPIFVALIERRFIVAEERRLRRKFLADWGRYTQQTRRWL